MGNRGSHGQSDSEEAGYLRDVFRGRSSRSKRIAGHSGGDDEVDRGTPRRHSSSSSSSEKLPGESGIESRPAGLSLKPDGIGKLAKELVVRSLAEENCDGISSSIFCKHLCHGNVYLGQALYDDCMKSGKVQKKSSPSKNGRTTLSKEQFTAGAQKLIQLIGESSRLTYYVQIFANEDQVWNKEDASHFLESCYHMSFGTSCRAGFCPQTVQMFVDAMFHGKCELNVSYAIHWLEENCPRVVTWMHNNLVHQLTVGFRLLERKRLSKSNSSGADNRESDSTIPTNLATPVLDLAQDPFSYSPCSPSSPLKRNLSFPEQAAPTQDEVQAVLSQTHLNPMQIWLLGCTLPVLFTRPGQPAKQSCSTTTNGLVLMDPHTFITRMIASQSPSHWTPLYNSDNDGLSVNRFEHHVTDYRGPTVTFLYAEGDRVFCLAIDCAWKQSIHFWGSADATLMQLSGEYRLLERGEKMVYYNTTVRGYPFGLHVGTDHRNPCIQIDKEFCRLNYRKIPYRLEGVQVWGCGTVEHRVSQLDHKKWEMKQVEKSRQVKLSALDWNDHPDKCLLDMAGHQVNYSQFSH